MKTTLNVALAIDFKASEPNERQILAWVGSCLNCNTNHAEVEVILAAEPEAADGTKPFTVLMARPDHIAEPYGTDTYRAWVRARNADEAQHLAQRQAYNADHDPLEEQGDIDAYAVLAVYEGHVPDIKTT
jgi:hypothetical protein